MESRRPRPPVSTRSTKLMEVRGVWSARTLVVRWVRAGRIEVRRRGRIVRKAVIWWGELKALDY